MWSFPWLVMDSSYSSDGLASPASPICAQRLALLPTCARHAQPCSSFEGMHAFQFCAHTVPRPLELSHSHLKGITPLPYANAPQPAPAPMAGACTPAPPTSPTGTGEGGKGRDAPDLTERAPACAHPSVTPQKDKPPAAWPCLNHAHQAMPIKPPYTCILSQQRTPPFLPAATVTA